MNSSIDYTPVILAQITDLQTRLTSQSNTIAILKGEIERLTGRHINDTADFTMKTSIPLRSHDNTDTYRVQRNQRLNTNNYTIIRPSLDRTNGRAHTNTSVPRNRPKVVTDNTHSTMSLSDILENNETVTIQVGTGKDSEGKFTYTTATAIFDGTNLNVTACELVESVVGMKSSKPGEILYKFIDELKSTGHIKRTFTIAPWKLCFVERNGIRKSLEDLRNIVA
jgi:hypothetical protein